MLIINGETQIKEHDNIFERTYFMRDASRRVIEIHFDSSEQEGLSYDLLAKTFVDGAQIMRQETTIRHERVLTNPPPEGAEPPEGWEPIWEDVPVEDTQEYDLTAFCVAGDIIDKRDGIVDEDGNIIRGNSFVVYMGQKLEAEIKDEEMADLILMLGGLE